MKFLFLDDMEKRHEIVRQTIEGPDCQVTHVYTADRAIRWLEKETFDIVSLDRDLHDDHYQTPSPKARSGEEVTDWIAQHAERFRQTRFIIHSWNPDGANRMAMTLKDAGLQFIKAPFSYATEQSETG